MADNKHQLSEQDDAEAGAVEAAPPPDPATASAAEPTVESMDDTASIPLGDTFSSLPRIEDVPPEPADDQASEPEGERMVPDAAESLPAEPAPEPSADQPESSSSVPSHLAPEQPKVRQQSGRNRPGWILPVIGGVAAVAAAAGLGLSIYSFATGSKTGDVHISNPIELVQSAQEDTTRDASEILTATESLTLDGADVSLPQNRTEVDVRDGKVMVTYRTQEAEAETYERATRAAAALALNLNGMSVQSSTTRTGMSDEVLPPTVAEDENSNGDSGHYGYYNEYGYYTWGYSNKKTIATPDLDVILSTGDGTEQATSVTVVAIDGNNQACLAVTLGVANATGVSTADDVITAAQSYGIDTTVFQKIQGWSKDFDSESDELPRTPWDAEILIGEGVRPANDTGSSTSSGYGYSTNSTNSSASDSSATGESTSGTAASTNASSGQGTTSGQASAGNAGTSTAENNAGTTTEPSPAQTPAADQPANGTEPSGPEPSGQGGTSGQTTTGAGDDTPSEPTAEVSQETPGAVTEAAG